jgi:hypothetical protein
MAKKSKEKQVDVEELTEEQAKEIGLELGRKLGAIGDEAAAKANKLTEVYGFKTVVAIQLVDIKTGQILS